MTVRRSGYAGPEKALAAAIVIVVSLLVSASAGGQRIEDFAFTALDGRTYESSALRGSPMVIVFLATWCAPCKKEAPELERAYAEYRGKGVLFIGLFVRSSEEGVRRFVEKYGITFPVGHDPGVLRQLGRAGVPSTAFVSGDGTLVRLHPGPVGAQELAEAIEELLGSCAD